jgi:hypothetical protein
MLTQTKPTGKICSALVISMYYTTPQTPRTLQYMLRYSPLSMFYVPLIRTLRASSESVVLVTRLCIVDEENLMPVEEMMEEVPMRRALEYLPRELDK